MEKDEPRSEEYVEQCRQQCLSPYSTYAVGRMRKADCNWCKGLGNLIDTIDAIDTQIGQMQGLALWRGCNPLSVLRRR